MYFMSFHSYMKTILGKILSPPTEQQILKSDDDALDQLLELFCEAWNVLTDLTIAHGGYFSQEQLDRLKVLDMELGLLRQEVSS